MSSNNILESMLSRTLDLEEQLKKEMHGPGKPMRSPRVDKVNPLNLIVYGAPGTGKTYNSINYAVNIINGEKFDNEINNMSRSEIVKSYKEYVNSGQILFTTFHQSYTYEDFVQGIKPYEINNNIAFRVEDGIFKKFADKALYDYANNYVIIIDEINRGNLSKIFGELITLLEDDKRCGELNELSVTLPLGGEFTIPNNLYIIGTMNSSDKSISLVDAALRRRFSFKELFPDDKNVNDDLRIIFNRLNEYLVKELKSTDLLVGHSYFIGKTSDEIPEIFNESIIPLLYEYFFNDKNRVLKCLKYCFENSAFVIDEESIIRRVRIKKASD